MVIQLFFTSLENESVPVSHPGVYTTVLETTGGNIYWFIHLLFVKTENTEQIQKSSDEIENLNV